jgi:hypothetical protein
VLRLTGAGFPRRKPVQITFAGTTTSGGVSSRAGTFARTLTVPPIGAGTAQISARVGSKALATTFSVVLDPVLVAAGDIACDPESPFFNGGNGTPTACHMKQTAALVQSLKPEVVAVLGDAQYEAGTPPDFRASYDRTWGAFKSITRAVIGNHEYGHQDGTGFFGYFGALGGTPRMSWYSYDVGAWHVIAFNDQCGEAFVTCAPRTTQERWLRADLAANASRCVLSYTHTPLYTSATTQVDPRARPLFQALLDAGVDVVLSGDSHHYERFAPQNLDGGADPGRGIRQFVVGTGGRDLRPFGAVRPNSEARNADTFGVLALTLHAGSYDWRFVPEPGRTFTDTGSQACR